MKRNNKILYFILVILLVSTFLISRNITGNVLLEEVKIENNFNYEKPLIINNISALEAINSAEKDIEILNESSFGLYFVNDKLIEAKTAYNYENYEEVFKITQLIRYTKDQAFRLLDLVSILEKKESEYSKQKVNTSLALEYLIQGKQSLKEERYNEAEAYLKETELKLESAKAETTRIRGLINLGKGFFTKYWLYILLIIIFIIIISPYVYRYYIIKKSKTKLNNLKLELKILNNLLKKTQEDAFKTRKLSMSTYKIRSERYKEKITKIKHTIPVLESLIRGKK